LWWCGEQEEARRIYRLADGIGSDLSWRVRGLFEDEEAVIDRLVRSFEQGVTMTAAYLRLLPEFEKLRGNPRFEALLRRAESDPKRSPLAALAPATDDKSVAVLPFANLSGDKEQEYFSDGLTEEILNTLARERDLRVPGRASSFSFKGKNASSAEIAKALNVSRLVEGSVRKAGNKVRISVSLTRASDGFSEELGTFTEELSDVFALQDKVARAVVEKLTQRTVATVAVGLTRDAAAYDAYLKGRALQTRAANTRAEAIAFYEQAVALDSNFALAWARLAEARFRTFGALYDRSPAVVQGTREAIERALAAQPDLPEALIMRANWRRGVEEDYAGAQRDLARVESLRPPTADLRYAQAALARDLSRFDEAFRFYREALLLDPQNGDFTNAYAVNLCMPRGEFVEADQLFRRAMTIQAPNSRAPFSNLIILRQAWRGPEAALRLLDRFPPTQAGWRSQRLSLLIALGRLDEARALAAELEGSLAPAGYLITLGPQDRPELGQLMALGLTDLVQARARQVVADASREFARGNRARRFRTLFIRAEIALGNRDSARAALEEWRAEAQRIKSDYRRYTDFTSGAFPLYALLGDANAVAALLQEVRASGLLPSDHLAHSPDYAAVRNDSRFQELVLQYNDWAKALPDPTDL
jgi:TolB-like protein/Flp pilus assembly protein TadD